MITGDQWQAPSPTSDGREARLRVPPARGGRPEDTVKRRIMVAAGASLGGMADVPGPGGLQLAERLLLATRVVGAHRGDRHHRLVHG
jgi:hypothetical protein